MNVKKPDDKAIILEVITKKNGIKKEVASAFGVTRRTINNWINEDEEIKNAFEDANENMIDFVESQMYLRMKGIPIYEKNKKTGKEEIVDYKVLPSDMLIKNYINTKGASRGYGEKKSLDITSNGNSIISLPIQPIPNPHIEE